MRTAHPTRRRRQPGKGGSVGTQGNLARPGSRGTAASGCPGRPSACKALRDVRGSAHETGGVQVRSGRPTTVVRASSPSTRLVGLPGWLPCGPAAPGESAPHVHGGQAHGGGHDEQPRPCAAGVVDHELVDTDDGYCDQRDRDPLGTTESVDPLDPQFVGVRSALHQSMIADTAWFRSTDRPGRGLANVWDGVFALVVAFGASNSSGNRPDGS